MRDIDIINKAIEDAQAEVANYLEGDPRRTQVTLERIMGILERDELIAAQVRLRQGYGRLRRETGLLSPFVALSIGAAITTAVSPTIVALTSRFGNGSGS
jgi:hypothetical protein